MSNFGTHILDMEEYLDVLGFAFHEQELMRFGAEGLLVLLISLLICVVV